MIATGTADGEVAVWDYEMSRLLGYAFGHKKNEITGIHFLWPYPLMVTTCMDSQVIIWRVRGVGEDAMPITCLYRFTNKSLLAGLKEKRQCGISTSFLR